MLRSTFVLLSALVIPQAAMGADATPEYVRSRGISYAGSGCPAGSVFENTSDPNKLTFTFDSFMVRAGAADPIYSLRRICQINVDLSYPAGWSYALADLDTKVFGHLPRGASGLVDVKTYRGGSPATTTWSKTFSGPMDGEVRMTTPASYVDWSPCGAARALNLNFQIRVSQRSLREPTWLSLTEPWSDDWQLYETTSSVRFGLKWKRCPR